MSSLSATTSRPSSPPALSAVFHYASTPHGNTLAPDPGTSYTTVPAPDARIAFPTTMDIAIIAAVITAVTLVLLCLLLVMLRYLFRHKGTYHTNEAKGTEFAESADVALQSDPALQDAGDTNKKEYFI
ncbi:glycophorin-C [Cavia porcellus]|nr:glycophorin-C [Cavia porcellus]